MNKLLPVVITGTILLGSFGNPGLSQEKRFRLGIRGGVNFATINRDISFGDLDLGIDELDLNVDLDKSTRNTLGAGISLEYWFSSNLALQANGLYNQKGFQVETAVKGSFFEPNLNETITISIQAKQTLRLAYFSVPLMLKVALGENAPGGLRPYLLAGPEIGFLLTARAGEISGSARLEAPGAEIDAIELISVPETDIEEEVKSTEFAFNFGAGLLFPLAEVDIFLDGRYGLGLSNFNKQGDEDAKNNVIYVNLGLIF